MTEPGRFADLVKANPNQATVAEYEYVWRCVLACTPCNVLVFGVGRDSAHWTEANADGRTLFVEHDREWIHEARRRVPGIEIVEVSYATRRILWRVLLHRPDRLLMRDLPESVLETRWGVIFVDAPPGHRWRQPGRMMSIYTASVLGRRSADAHILVHDCDRNVERIYCDTYLTPDRMVTQVDTLRHYRLGTKVEGARSTSP